VTTRAIQFDARAVADLDRVLHEPARLSVVACLSVVDEADFVFLQSQTGMTGGNLSSHVKKLESTGYVAIRKEFVGARPRTTLCLTPEGRAAFQGYVRSLRALLAAVDTTDDPGAAG
jgi:DNA-binding MarR family transcriptional regulator